jgi:hypothetical protein
MKQNRCEREIEVVDALRTGAWTPELDGHLRTCAVCAETRLVAGSLLRRAAALRMEIEPPTAGPIWRRAQARRQEMALRRATRPLIFMRAVSMICVIAFAAWLLRSFGHFADRGLISGWGAMTAQTAAAGAAIAVACIAVGAWYLLHEGKRQDGAVSST